MFIDVYISLVCLSSHRFCIDNTLVKYQNLSFKYAMIASFHIYSTHYS